MAFRQFPATAADGESYVVIEFRQEPDSDVSDGDACAPRYELADGRHLIRAGTRFSTVDGELTLSTR